MKGIDVIFFMLQSWICGRKIVREVKSATNPLIFFAWINFRCCPDYFGEKVLGLVFFLQMLYLFKVRNLGAFWSMDDNTGEWGVTGP